MHAFFAFFAPSLLFFSSLLTAATAYYPQGTIQAPANGTRIAPGAAFAFDYRVRSDYCLSPLNYTVVLLTSDGGPPQVPFLALGAENQFATGHYFGRFQEQSFANNPAKPAPAKLVMPDFSKSPGGFGSGATATNKTMYLAVIEEWTQCAGALGSRFSVAWNTVVYNATSKA